MSEPTLAELLVDQPLVTDNVCEYAPPQKVQRVRNVLDISGLPASGVGSLVGKQFDIPARLWQSVKRILDREARAYGLHLERDHASRWRWRYNKRGGKTFYGGNIF